MKRHILIHTHRDNVESVAMSIEQQLSAVRKILSLRNSSEVKYRFGKIFDDIKNRYQGFDVILRLLELIDRDPRGFHQRIGEAKCTYDIYLLYKSLFDMRRSDLIARGSTYTALYYLMNSHAPTHAASIIRDAFELSWKDHDTHIAAIETARVVALKSCNESIALLSECTNAVLAFEQDLPKHTNDINTSYRDLRKRADTRGPIEECASDANDVDIQADQACDYKGLLYEFECALPLMKSRLKLEETELEKLKNELTNVNTAVALTKPTIPTTLKST